ncbi:MAG: hypothetical protein PWQ82_1210 [Thermosediminibacterales bacterium]|nr:hypothetical protein [Thermosediminibacterales bacterium]
MFGIILGLALLMFVTMRGVSILIAGPALALVVAIFGNIPLLEAYTKHFMGGAAGYFQAWFPTFLLGAIFGKIMDDTGAAESLAHWIISKIGKERAILAIVAATAVLTYGGISLFVVVFTMYPLAMAIFKEADLPKRLIPGCIALGAFTFTMTALPGTPQIQNIIPTKYFGTDAMAAPIVGLVAAAVMAVGGTMYMNMRAKKAKENGEKFVPGPKDERYLKEATEDRIKDLPNPGLSLLPLLAIIVLLDIFKLNIVVSLTGGVVLAFVLFYKRMENPLNSLNQGAMASMLAILNTASAVGFGTVVKVVPGFKDLVALLSKVSLGNGLIYDAIATNILAGSTGSASGGMSIALEAMADQFLATGANPELLHRIASLASGGLDTLPHNGAVLTLLAVCGLTHKDSYIDIFTVSLLIPVISVIIAIILGSIGIV